MFQSIHDARIYESWIPNKAKETKVKFWRTSFVRLRSRDIRFDFHEYLYDLVGGFIQFPRRTG